MSFPNKLRSAGTKLLHQRSLGVWLALRRKGTGQSIDIRIYTGLDINNETSYMSSCHLTIKEAPLISGGGGPNKIPGHKRSHMSSSSTLTPLRMCCSRRQWRRVQSRGLSDIRCGGGWWNCRKDSIILFTMILPRCTFLLCHP